MLRSLLTEKSLRAKPEDFCQLIQTETEDVLSILKHFTILMKLSILLLWT